MTTAQKRAALLSMLQAAVTIARDLSDSLTASADVVENQKFTSDSAASNTSVGALLVIEQATDALVALRTAAVTLNLVRS